ncbi:MAG TPA: response regulator [Allocoleopsis sp.]
MGISELQGLKALVVDDYVYICCLVELILDTLGVVTTCATSVHEALEIYGFLKPDFLIVDIDLPGENGLSLIRYIIS